MSSEECLLNIMPWFTKLMEKTATGAENCHRKMVWSRFLIVAPKWLDLSFQSVYRESLRVIIIKYVLVAKFILQELLRWKYIHDEGQYHIYVYV